MFDDPVRQLQAEVFPLQGPRSLAGCLQAGQLLTVELVVFGAAIGFQQGKLQQGTLIVVDRWCAQGGQLLLQVVLQALAQVQIAHDIDEGAHRDQRMTPARLAGVDATGLEEVLP
ncbi:hypothetical protein D9M71_617990 [compost metagenome]